MLAGERDADDGDEEQCGEYEVDQCRIKTAEDQPDDVGDQREAAHPAIGGHDPFAEGPEDEAGQFEALQTEGDAYDGDAQYKPAEDIAECGGESAKDQPDDVADKVHRLKIMILSGRRVPFIISSGLARGGGEYFVFSAMRNLFFSAFLVLFVFCDGVGQAVVVVGPTIGIPATLRGRLPVLLDTLFSQIDRGKVDSALLDPRHAELTADILLSLKGVQHGDSSCAAYTVQLINCYAAGADEYFISLCCSGVDARGIPVIKSIFTLMARWVGGAIVFCVPVDHFTKGWATTVVGNVTYHSLRPINLERARLFDQKNTVIANKLGLPSAVLQFYLCNDYQEALCLMGYAYDRGYNGVTRRGAGVIANTIFSVMNNEDFSHDLFHDYSYRIRTVRRNGAAEEGIAYSWGNAYYVDGRGGTITMRELVPDLRAYLSAHSGVSLLALFRAGGDGFSLLAPEVSGRNTIAALLSDEVEREKGVAGIRQLINCGPGDDNYFVALNELIGVNPANFDVKVRGLLDGFK